MINSILVPINLNSLPGTSNIVQVDVGFPCAVYHVIWSPKEVFTFSSDYIGCRLYPDNAIKAKDTQILGGGVDISTVDFVSLVGRAGNAPRQFDFNVTPLVFSDGIIKISGHNLANAKGLYMTLCCKRINP